MSTAINTLFGELRAAGFDYKVAENNDPIPFDLDHLAEEWGKVIDVLRKMATSSTRDADEAARYIGRITGRLVGRCDWWPTQPKRTTIDTGDIPW